MCASYQDRKFFNAADNGDLTEVIESLEKGANINWKDVSSGELNIISTYIPSPSTLL